MNITGNNDATDTPRIRNEKAKDSSDREKNDVQTQGDGLIVIEHLKKSYENVAPIKDVNCTINSGDVISIIGPSGTGKSTLLNLINHLEVADGGRILFDGADTLSPGYDYCGLRRRVGMVFQSFNLFEHLSVVENVMLAQTELL